MELTLIQKVAISNFIVMLLLGVALGEILAMHIENEAIDDAKMEVFESVSLRARDVLTEDFFKGQDQTKKNKLGQEYSKFILSKDIVRIKIFNTDGVIIYSDEEKLIGEKFSSDDLNRALNNESVAEIERDLANKEEHLYEQGYEGLMGIYTPIFLDGEELLGVIEVYFILDRLDAKVRNAQTYIGLGLIGGMIALYFSLFFIVKKASTTLIGQDVQLKAEKKKLEEKDRIKSDFISVASHELRTPLSKIQGYIEYLTYKRYIIKEGEQKIKVVRGSIN